MALYEYRCKECEKVFTVRQSISEHESGRKKPECPECGSRRTVQLMSGFYPQTATKS